MSDLDRLIKLAGLAANEVAEGSYNETITVCKDCGDRPHMPTISTGTAQKKKFGFQ